MQNSEIFEEGQNQELDKNENSNVEIMEEGKKKKRRRRRPKNSKTRDFVF